MAGWKLSRTNRWLLSILALGTILRLLWIYYVNTQPIFDFKHYSDLAMSLLRKGEYTMPEGLDYIKASTDYIQAGAQYPTAFRPPGYPLFLVPIYAIFPNILAAKLANVGLSVIWMLCMFWLGKKYFGERAGLWAAFLTAIFPMAISYTSVLGIEILSATLLTALLCIVAYGIGGRWGGAVIVGLFAGFLSLIKPTYIVLPILLWIVLWWRREEGDKPFSATGWRKWLVSSVTTVLCTVVVMVLVISPWTIRNYHAFHRFVPISTNGNFVLYLNNNDLSLGRYMDALSVPNSIFKTARILDADGNYNEADAMKAAGVEAKHWIWSHKLDFTLLGFKRWANSFLVAGNELWEWTMSVGEVRFDHKWVEPLLEGAKASGLVVVGGGMLYFLLLIGPFFRRKPLNHLHKMNLMFIAFFTFVIFISEGQPRYMFPMYPFFLLAISWAILNVSESLKSDRKY